ncbi:ATP12 family chaperone protein [Minwuia thermotolerans]|uniref:ATPase n=1 Tax=Minwuia thermotolerans TaxID=2056226 RepID=A0A2M9FYS9_9PROT|nr:ATP12 family protein [Minwuia thermotolerans]PJK28612.1 ATPase [Minwuia thermotolerans]
MKRFYEKVGVEEAPGGWEVRLDGRAMRTPARQPFRLPTRALADLVADEWAAQGEKIDHQSMPLTRMAGTAVDGFAGRREDTRRAVARFAEADMLCYWADQPQRLIERQQAQWRPLLDWAEDRFGARLQVTSSLNPVRQSPAALEALERAVRSYDDFRLAGLSVAAGAAGSLVIGLALVERRVDAAAAFEAAQLDESFQIEEWGEDAEAAHRRAAIRGELARVERLVGAL